MKKLILSFALIVLIIGCVSCAKQEEKPTGEQNTQIANPASVYCEEQGGTLEIRTDANGGQIGYCLKDGTECEEWAYYRGECPKTAEEQIEEEQTGETEKLKDSEVNPNPFDILSDDVIEKFGANCKDKETDLEKANCILDWQENNIFWCYTHPEETALKNMFEAGYPDCVVDMQFQQMVPGSFPVSKIFGLKQRNNKFFGACYTYATTYCAIARWNGLKCRVMAVKIITPMIFSASSGDYDIGYCGAAPKSYLDTLGLDCNDWKTKDWIVNEDHYWAEVLIDGEWVIMEKPIWAYKRDTETYIINAGRSYGDTGW